jgi:hypothetical protein
MDETNAPVHSSQSTNMCKDVLYGIGQLERVHVAQAELHVRIDDELSEAQDFATQVECVSEAGLFALLRGQSFDGLQCELKVRRVFER